MKWHLFFVVISLMVGCGIVGMSLMSASEVFSPDSISTPQNFTLNQPVIPGHLLYPFTAISSKLQVWSASETEKPYKQLEVATQRLEDSAELISLKKTGLAAQTLLKGQQYIASVVDYLVENTDKQELRIATQEMLKEYHNIIIQHKEQFSDTQKVLLDQLSSENSSLQQKINP